eukprot:TRINITY_DN11045_c0_g1_i1.p2 TRINITY_DN11045_c0_g1~~TRINITY_DN11045_c0_g1_i1.p2  ORF type:complete len:119 (+),score=5.16 TRINITY_DN11045_c0_g1_i1:214-570(+)
MYALRTILRKQKLETRGYLCEQSVTKYILLNINTVDSQQFELLGISQIPGKNLNQRKFEFTERGFHYSEIPIMESLKYRESIVLNNRRLIYRKFLDLLFWDFIWYVIFLIQQVERRID